MASKKFTADFIVTSVGTDGSFKVIHGSPLTKKGEATQDTGPVRLAIAHPGIKGFEHSSVSRVRVTIEDISDEKDENGNGTDENEEGGANEVQNTSQTTAAEGVNTTTEAQQ